MDPVLILIALSVALGFICGYGVRAAISHYHRRQARGSRLARSEDGRPNHHQGPPLQPSADAHAQSQDRSASGSFATLAAKSGALVPSTCSVFLGPQQT